MAGGGEGAGPVRFSRLLDSEIVFFSDMPHRCVLQQLRVCLRRFLRLDPLQIQKKSLTQLVNSPGRPLMERAHQCKPWRPTGIHSRACRNMKQRSVVSLRWQCHLRGLAPSPFRQVESFISGSRPFILSHFPTSTLDPLPSTPGF